MTPPALARRTTGPEETRALAGAVASVLRPGDVVALTGELGAGKTCFVQGAAAAVGVRRRVTSPTFLLLRTYPGDVRVVHCDVYRLDNLREVSDLGDDLMAPDALTFIEWGDAIAMLLPSEHLEVELRHDGDDARRIDLRPHGGFVDRVQRLDDATAAWRADDA